MSWVEEEESEDELASMAIRTHEFRAEKVRLEEEVAARTEAADREIAELKGEIAIAHDALVDLEIVDLRQPRASERRTVSRRTPRVDRVTIDLQLDIETAERHLAELTEEVQQEELQQKNEIVALMRKVEKAKQALDLATSEADRMEAENEEKEQRLDRLRRQLRTTQQNIATAKQKRMKKEAEFGRLAGDADAIVHKRYRTKSRHVP
jgi:chromosome segregation ATPase